ncbi:hypothetical protein VIAE109791_07815 [Vibrio aestuarianus subsp. francensis]
MDSIANADKDVTDPRHLTLVTNAIFRNALSHRWELNDSCNAKIGVFNTKSGITWTSLAINIPLISFF